MNQARIEPTRAAPRPRLAPPPERGPSPVPKILVIDDHASIRDLLGEALAMAGYQSTPARDAAEAARLLRGEPFDAVLVDIVMEEPDSGLELLPTIAELQPDTPAIVISGEANMSRVMAALRAGAYDFLCKPFNLVEVSKAVGNAVEKRRMARENERLLDALRAERDKLEERVRDATRDLAAKIGALRSLNEQISTLFEMARAGRGHASPAQVLEHLVALLRKVVAFEGAYCLLFDPGAQQFTVAYASSEKAEAARDRVAARLADRRDALTPPPGGASSPEMVETLRAAWRELGAEAHPHPERALMIPLHAPGAMLGVFGAIDLERPHVLNDAEERILSFAISNFLAALHERSFLRRTTQLASFGELVTEIAHDLRHPMTSMRGAARVLRNQWSDEAKRERCLMALGSDLSRMESLVTELVTFYRGDDISMVSVDLHQLLDKALEAVAQTIEREAIEVERRYEADPAAVMGLARNLIEAFVNLFVNAIQAMGRGGLLTVRTSPNLEDADLSRLVAAGLDPSEYVRVDVADTGPGIAPENVDKIFMRFFTTKPDGCGLGLSAVHRILKKNLGLIRVESEPGRGATFTVLLPKA